MKYEKTLYLEDVFLLKRYIIFKPSSEQCNSCQKFYLKNNFQMKKNKKQKKQKQKKHETKIWKIPRVFQH